METQGDASVLTLNKAATAVHQHQPGNFKGVGVYSVSKDQHQDSKDDNKTKGGVTNSLLNRKLTPAHPHMVNHSRPMPFKPPTLQPTIEVDEVLDQHEMSRDVTMSPAAQAHALSLFLSSSTSDSDEPNSETVIAAVYRDPLDDCMDGIEQLASGILRTSRLTVQGEPGDMSKIQPALFGLQAMEKQMPQLLPQVMQYPFFSITDKDDSSSGWSSSFEEDSVDFQLDDFLSSGHVRLGLPIDTAIYALLRSHCAKGAKQAEALISTASNYNYNPAHSRILVSHMPPVICRSSLNHKSSQIRNGHHKLVRSRQDPATKLKNQEQLGVVSNDDHTPLKNQASNSSISERSERSTSGVSLFSSASTTSSSSLPNIDEDGDTPTTTPTEVASPSSIRRHKQNASKRKDSLAHLHRPPSSGSEFSLDDYPNQQSDRKLIPDWNTSTLDNNVIMSQYGDSSYPLLMWDPRFKVDFRLSSSLGLITGIVTGIDPEKSTVTMKVTNTTGRKVGFAIRAHRQTTVFKPYIIFPSKGLCTLGAGESERIWEDNVEFYPTDTEKNESFVIDLFVCTLDDNPAWNVQRRYAIMKAQKSPSVPPKRQHSKRRPSHFHLPGTMEQKEENLKLIISHGLQCVVKKKFDEAEVILSQALHLPDFQRVPLKSFLYICLGVVADKRKKLGHSKTLMPVLMATNAAQQLVEIAESTPGSIKMPKTLMLVKQLKKELNITKSMKDEHRKIEKQSSTGKMEEKEESCNIQSDGGKIIHKMTELTIPAGAVRDSTQVTLSAPDFPQLRTLLKSQGWDQMVNLCSAMHIQCTPFMERFEKPVEITTVVETGLALHTHTEIRLLQSKYLRHWQDITDDLKSSVRVEGSKMFITTDQTGWIAVAVVQYNISQIARLAMRSLSAEPITLQLSTYGLVDSENSSIQVAIFVTPRSPSDGSATKNDEGQKPQHHRPIAFPHTIQAYPGEKLQLRLQGRFQPDELMGEKDLNFEFEVQQNFQRILEKWLTLTPAQSEGPAAGPSSLGHARMLCGKLIVNSCRNATQQWEPIAEINLSTKAGYATMSTSSSGSELSSH